jgi:hypothetical protein
MSRLFRLIAETFAPALHPTDVIIFNNIGCRFSARLKEYVMLVRFSAAMAAVCLLSGAAFAQVTSSQLLPR